MRFDGILVVMAQFTFFISLAFGPSARAHPALPSEDVRPVNEFS
jgi:hypothetical protein